MTDAEYDAALAALGWKRGYQPEQATDSGSWCSSARRDDTTVFGAGKTLIAARENVLAKVREREALRQP